MRGQEGRLYYAAVLWCDVMLAIPRHSVLIVGAVSICLTYSPYYVLVWERNRPPPPFLVLITPHTNPLTRFGLCLYSERGRR